MKFFYKRRGNVITDRQIKYIETEIGMCIFGQRCYRSYDSRMHHFYFLSVGSDSGE